MANDKHADDSLAIVDNIIGMIADEVDTVKAGAVFTRWLEVQKSFWSYSFSNAMLIAFQAHRMGFQASRVAGFGTWKSLGRWVKKGEKAIWILAPNFRKVEDKATGDKKNIVTGFRSVTVFDVSQTDGQDLPVLDWRNHEEDDKGLSVKLEAEYITRGIDLAFISAEEMAQSCPGANGFSRGKYVAILNTLTGVEKASTMAHELAHSILHFQDGSVLEKDHSRSVMEIEAESIAACVLGGFGLEWRASAMYIACWKGDRDSIKKSMTRIASTSKLILSAITSEPMEE
jgi:antirestriction protein ArdC